MSIDNNLKCSICGNPAHPGACGGGGGDKEEENKQDRASKAQATSAADHQNIVKTSTTAISPLWTNTSENQDHKRTAVMAAPEPNAAKQLTEEEKAEVAGPKTSDPQKTQESTDNKQGRKNSPFNMRLTR